MCVFMNENLTSGYRGSFPITFYYRWYVFFSTRVSHAGPRLPAPSARAGAEKRLIEDDGAPQLPR